MPLGANKVALFGSSGVVTDTSVLLATGVASASASLTFTIPATYKEYVFGFYNIAPATDNVDFQFQCSIDSGSNYNVTMTTTYFRAYNFESDGPGLGYLAYEDQAQGTAFQTLGRGVGGGSDQSFAGEMHLFSPANTTYVKNFYATSQFLETSSGVGYPQTSNAYIGGYFNDGSNDLTNISFKFGSGNIASGTIKMWGVR